jgi:hypothetical protein
VLSLLHALLLLLGCDLGAAAAAAAGPLLAVAPAAAVGPLLAAPLLVSAADALPKKPLLIFDLGWLLMLLVVLVAAAAAAAAGALVPA